MPRQGHTPSLLNHITKYYFSGNLFYRPLEKGLIVKVLNGNPKMCSFFLSKFKTALPKSISDACGLCGIEGCADMTPVSMGSTWFGASLLSAVHSRVFAERFRFSLPLLSFYFLLCRLDMIQF